MFEVVIPGLRLGEYKLYEASKKGRVAYIAGYSTTYSSMVMRVPTTSAGAKNAHFPINKLEYAVDGADTSLAAIAAGTKIIAYDGGEYITDDLHASAKAYLHGKTQVHGLALIIDHSGRPLPYAACATSQQYLAARVTANSTAGVSHVDDPDLQFGYIVSYTDISTTVGYLRYHVHPLTPMKWYKTSTALATG